MSLRLVVLFFFLIIIILCPCALILVDQSTCTRAIVRLRGAFSDQGTTSADAEPVLDEFMDLANGIQRALFEFDSTSNHAVVRLYNRAGASGSTSHASPVSASTEGNPNPFLSGDDNEHVFLVYLYVNVAIPFGIYTILTCFMYQFHI